MAGRSGDSRRFGRTSALLDNRSGRGCRPNYWGSRCRGRRSCPSSSRSTARRFDPTGGTAHRTLVGRHNPESSSGYRTPCQWRSKCGGRKQESCCRGYCSNGGWDTCHRAPCLSLSDRIGSKAPCPAGLGTCSSPAEVRAAAGGRTCRSYLWWAIAPGCARAGRTRHLVLWSARF